MKKKLCTSILSLIILLSAQAQTHVQLLPGQSPITQQISDGQGPAVAIRKIQVIVEYWRDVIPPAQPVPCSFSITNISAGAIPMSPRNVTQAVLRIPADSFTTLHKIIKTDLYVQLSATSASSLTEFFDIQVAGSPVTSHRVIIQPAGTIAGGTRSIQHLALEKLLAPQVSANPGSSRISYFLRYKMNGLWRSDTTITLQLKANSGSTVLPVLVNNSFTVHGDPTSDTARIDSALVAFDINAVKDFSEDEEFYLSFAGDIVYDTLVFTRRKLVNPNKSFWIEVGSNFDFADGLQPNNFFSGVFFHKRDIRRVSLRRKSDTSADGRNMAIFAGVYESKTISNLNTFRNDSGYLHYDKINAPVKGDSIGIFRDTGITKITQVVKNISLFFSPQIRLTDKSANQDGLHIFLSYWAEVQWQQLIVENDYSQMTRKDILYVQKDKANSYLSSNEKRTLDIKTHYQGIGFPFYYKDHDVNMYINPVFGWTTQLRDDELNNYLDAADGKNQRQIARCWRPFYVFQFRLNEEKYGFAFTGEVRGLVMKSSPPFISLALSKKFDLAKFLEFK